jgi:hypothetical protein
MGTSPPPIPPVSSTPAPAGQPTITDTARQDWRKLSFDFLSDSTKQLITVATGVVTATVLFSKDLDAFSRHWALAAWVVLTLSVLFGIAVLFNMSGNLHNTAQGEYPAPSIAASGIRFFSIGQISFFLLGIALLIVFGCFATTVPAAVDAKPLTVNCIVPPAQVAAANKTVENPQPAPAKSKVRHPKHQ